ncbi:MAG: hypothetical protein EAZ39_01420 [Oscillatoriales cyanobacterium]|nr:MAG: hypothetical protein EAZ39_01420 [Oscillatoriales cyanobacterium]
MSAETETIQKPIFICILLKLFAARSRLFNLFLESLAKYDQVWYCFECFQSSLPLNNPGKSGCQSTATVGAIE